MHCYARFDERERERETDFGGSGVMLAVGVGRYPYNISARWQLADSETGRALDASALVWERYCKKTEKC